MQDITIYLFLDESGDKGYSTSRPRDGLGVMAGFLVDDFVVSRIKEEMTVKLKALNIDDTSKLHMSALDNEQKNKSIDLVRSLFKQFQLNFFYEAIATESFLDFASSAAPKKESMHSQLLQNILMKALMYCKGIIEKYQGNINLKVVSDNIDSGVLKGMENDISIIVNFLNNDWSRRYITKKQFIETRTTSMSPDPRPTKGKFKVNLTVETSEITFISDVLAYTTFKHLKKYMNENEGLSLNTKMSTSGHPLEEFLILQFTPELEDINILGKIFGPGRGK
nr:hypothetical protein [Providencia rettgeri]